MLIVADQFEFQAIILAMLNRSFWQACAADNFSQFEDELLRAYWFDWALRAEAASV